MKIKTSTTPKLKQYVARTVLVLAVAVMALGLPGRVFADTYDEQIRQIQNEVDGYQAEAGRLRSEANTFQNAMNVLTAQKNAIQAQVDLSQAKFDKLVADIAESERKLAQQQEVLASTISDLSQETTTSPIELLAGSNSIGDFIDRQEYRSSVQEQIQSSIKEIKELKIKLAKQKVEVELVLADQKSQRDTLAAKEAEQAQLLAATQGQEAAYQGLIGEKNSQIASLRDAQRAANARFIGAAGSGPACGGGYPGQWCNIPMDSVADNWGMYNRECVSYTAFRVAASGRHMPYWGGAGNANQWDDNAYAAGIPADSSPRAGDVAISNAGYYGHAMYVESVNPNGTINISQYNADLRGTFSTNTISPGGLVFIHF